MNQYDVGDRIRASVVFTNTTTGADADPTTVTASVRRPDGVTLSYIVTSGEIVKDSTGHYHLDIDASAEGHWYYRFTGTGAVVAASPDGSFFIRDSVFA
jgi:hypothetical protein